MAEAKPPQGKFENKPERPFNLRDEFENKPDKAHEDYLKNMTTAIVILFNLGICSNIGSIIRTASLFAFGGVHILGKRAFNARASVGTDHYIPITKISATKGVYNEFLDYDIIIKHFEELSKTHTIVMVEHGGIDVREMNGEIKKLDKPPAFVMGQEDTGIPDEILKNVPHLCVSIPQKGVCRSYNVGVAFGIVGYAWTFD